MNDATTMRRQVRDVIQQIRPFDETEAGHRAGSLAWIDGGAPIWRTAKPATPPKHLVSYTVVANPALDHVLLVDHRLAGLWLPAGGHVEPGEHPTDCARREVVEELGIDPVPHPAAGRQPVLVTVTTTVGATAGHDDVSLWYAFTADIGDPLSPDRDEFVDIRWWPVTEVRHSPGTRFDPHLPRFLAKLVAPHP